MGGGGGLYGTSLCVIHSWIIEEQTSHVTHLVTLDDVGTVAKLLMDDPAANHTRLPSLLFWHQYNFVLKVTLFYEIIHLCILHILYRQYTLTNPTEVSICTEVVWCLLYFLAARKKKKKIQRKFVLQPCSFCGIDEEKKINNKKTLYSTSLLIHQAAAIKCVVRVARFGSSVKFRYTQNNQNVRIERGSDGSSSSGFNFFLGRAVTPLLQKWRWAVWRSRIQTGVRMNL